MNLNFIFRTLSQTFLTFALVATISCGGGTTTGDTNDINSATPDFSGTTSVESLEVEAGSTRVIAGGSVITITANDTLDGTLQVQSGGATLVFTNGATFNGTIESVNSTSTNALSKVLAQTTDSDQEPDDVTIVAQGDVNFGEDFSISADTSFKLTDDLSTLPTNDEFDTEATTDDGQDSVLFPEPESDTDGQGTQALIKTIPGAEPLEQATSRTWNLSGTWVFRTPPAGVKRLVVAIQPSGSTQVNLTNLSITGPNGRAGTDKTATGTCTGEDGRNAMTFVGRIVGNLTINNFTLNLGDGGAGGACTADGDPNATATGGAGGKAGNMKIRTTGSLDIQGTMTLNPGNGGAGGAATANALDGNDACDPTVGGNATATGGAGGATKKVLRARNVTGLTNLSVGDFNGGVGGASTANAGIGGDNTCLCPPQGTGADGGDAVATGGAGGDAGLDVSGLAVTTGTVTSGNGGDAASNNGQGGKGTDCGKSEGGTGGIGGDMTSTKGAKGTASGIAADGTDGTASLGANAGKGGTGGDGIPAGAGGAGGTCTIDGAANPCPNGDDGTLRDDLITIFCIDLFDLFVSQLGVSESGGFDFASNPELTNFGAAFQDESMTDTVGSVPIELVDLGLGQIFTSASDATPPHIAITDGIFDIQLDELSLNSGATPDLVGFKMTVHSFNDPTACTQLQATASTASGANQSVSFPIEYGADGSFQVDSFFDVFTEIDIDSTPITGLKLQGAGESFCYLYVETIYIIDP